MAYTIEQYEKLKESISLGALKVQYSDKTVEYRSLDEMLRILSLMERELFPNKNNSGKKYADFSRGTGTKKKYC